MDVKNLLLPSLSRRKCLSLSLVNRVPESDLEGRLYDIRKHYAKFKDDSRVEEAKMWDELYTNHKELKKSFVSKYSLHEVLHNKDATVLPKIKSLSPEANNASVPFAEAYKEFVTFKANTMLEMRLKVTEKRPKYSTLYAKEFLGKNRNKTSYEKVIRKYQNKDKCDKVVMDLLNSSSSKPSSIVSSRQTDSQTVEARPYHSHDPSMSRSKSQDDIKDSHSHRMDFMNLDRLPTIDSRPNALQDTFE